MTISDVENLNLGISPLDEKNCIIVESAFSWINQNTTLNYDVNNLPENIPANVKLFIIKYAEIMNMSGGVSSESIDGLSQSFDTTDKSVLLWQFADELLGNDLKSDVQVMQANNRWC